MEEKKIVYGITNLGLLFVPESRAKKLAESNKALLSAKTWGEFKELVSQEMYEFYLVNSAYYEGPSEPEDGEYAPYDIAPETPFTPNDVVTYDALPAYPEIEMSEWIPEEIQAKFGRKTRYSAMDVNVPEGDILVLDETQMDEIVAALEKLGYECRREEDMLMACTTLDFDPDDYPNVDEDDESDEAEETVTYNNSPSTDDIKRGMYFQLKNGWFGTMMDNKKGNVRLAEIEAGDFCEIGSIYTPDIVRVKINDEWVEIK